MRNLSLLFEGGKMLFFLPFYHVKKHAKLCAVLCLMMVSIGAANAAGCTNHTYDRTGWSASSNVNDHKANTIFNSIHNDNAQRWETGPTRAGKWLMVDMKTPIHFNQIVLDLGIWLTDPPQGYDVEISDDGIGWTYIYSGTFVSPSLVQQVEINLLSNPVARFFKITLTVDHGYDIYWGVAELFVKIDENNCPVSTCGGGAFTIPKVYNAPTIDGLEDTNWVWDMAPWVTINGDHKQTLNEGGNCQGNGPQLVGGLAAKWRAVYDGTNVYFYVRVFDANPSNDGGVESVWKMDGIEIYIDKPGSGDGRFQYGVGYAVPNGYKYGDLTGTQVVTRNISGGYWDAEISIPVGEPNNLIVTKNSIKMELGINQSRYGETCRSAQLFTWQAGGDANDNHFNNSSKYTVVSFSDCSSVVSSDDEICSGGAIASLTTAMTVPGMTHYVWQQSQSATGPWAPIEGTSSATNNNTVNNIIPTIAGTVMESGTIYYCAKLEPGGVFTYPAEVVVISEPVETLTNPTFCVGALSSEPAKTIAGRTVSWFASDGATPASAPSIKGLTSNATYYYKVSNGNCVSNLINYVVTVNSAPTPVVSPVNCSGGYGNIKVTVSPTGSYQYKLDGGSYQASDEFTGLADANSRTVTIKDANNCEATSAPFNISCGCANGPTLSLSASNSSTCVNSPVTTDATFGGAGGVEIASISVSVNGGGAVTPATPITVSGTTLTYTPAPSDAGKTVTVTITTNNPQGGASCVAATAIWTITVEASLTPTVTISANPAGSVCTGTPVQYTASPENGGTPVYKWLVDGVVQHETSSVFNYTPSNGEDISCEMTSDLSCVSSATVPSNIITASVTTNLPLFLSAVPDITTAGPGQKILLQATNYPNTTYVWTGNNKMLESTTSNCNVQLYKTTEFEVKVSDGVCINDDAKATLKISVEWPNAIMPNSGNDIFLPDIDDRTMMIFNRSGQKIFEGKGGWNGKYNGKEVDPGTYFYVIDLPDGDVHKSTVEVVAVK